jgi:hypothetical protein
MLKSKSKDVQRNSAKVLSHLATEQSIRVSIVDEGAITPLLDLLIDPVAENSMAACKALLNIAVYVTCRVNPFAPVSHAHLVQVCGGEEQDRCGGGHATLCEAAGYASARGRAHAAAHVCYAQPGQYIWISARFPLFLLFVQRCLTAAVQHPKNHIQFVRDGILPRLFSVLRSPMKSVKHKHFACVSLSEVCTPLDNHRQICEEGGLNAMVALCGHFSEDVRSFAALAVERLAENSSLRRPLAEAGVVPPLVMMLAAKKMFSQKNAALALGSLAQVSTHRSCPFHTHPSHFAGSSESNQDCAAGRPRLAHEAFALRRGRAGGDRHPHAGPPGAEQHQPATHALQGRVQTACVQCAVRRLRGEQNQLQNGSVGPVQNGRAQERQHGQEGGRQVQGVAQEARARPGVWCARCKLWRVVCRTVG